VITTRSCCILLHPTSLPGGRLGAEAYRFVDWLEAAGQSWWQVLPLQPPDEHGSPYNSASAFAASTDLLADPGAPVSRSEVDSFRRRHACWLDDLVAVQGEEVVAPQIRFEREWGKLQSYARERGVRLIGDVPMFVSPSSVDVRAHPELFRRTVQTGAPPDDFNPGGQLWGGAPYDWHALRADGYGWWVRRLRRSLGHVDVLRVDHFRGFVAAWEVPARASSAVRGRWRRGPGLPFFRVLERELGALPLIAEDLGRITEPVERLRDELGLPGIRVLQFGFAGSRRNPHRPESHVENAVVVTGTHDNDTARGWWERLTARQRATTGLDPSRPHWSLVRLAYASPARLAIVPAQDVLGLGSEARMNSPGRVGGNWSWRLEPGQLTDRLAERLRAEAVAAGRVSSSSASAASASS
jgi:4-alpha-glucanotransferase